MLMRIWWFVVCYVLLLTCSKIVPMADARPANPARRQGATCTPPLPPTGLVGTANNISTINWTWNPALGATSYHVFEVQGTGAVLLGTVTSTFFAESSLVENSVHVVYVTAVNNCGESAPSNEDRKYTLVQQRDFTLVPGDSQIEVSVVPPPNMTADKTGCTIQKTSPAAGIVDLTGVYQFIDQPLKNGTQYCYKVAWKNGDGISTEFTSTEKCATPKANPPSCITRIEIPQKPTYLPEGDPTGDEMKPGRPAAKLLVLVHWEQVGPPSGMDAHFITVTINPSHIVGQCLNSGSSTFEDFTIENSDNQSIWNLTGPDLVYKGLQTLSATTKKPYPPNVRVPIVLTPYDWRATVTITAQAGDCTPDIQEGVQDTDGDKLPDEFERQSKFWMVDKTGKRVLKDFDPGSDHSAGPNGPIDTDNDLDLENRAEPIQNEFGDGLTAYEEYQAVKVRGKVQRTNKLKNDGPGGAVGGTAVKDFFVFDDQEKTKDPLFRADNPYLEDYKLIWHLIDKSDMTDEKTGKTELAGFMNEHGNKNQRAIWLHKSDKPVVFEDTRQLAATVDFAVNSGTQILVDTEYIDRVATVTGAPADKLLNWAIAHEIGHKLTLHHPTRDLDFLAGGKPPAPANVDVFWLIANNQFINFYAPVFDFGGTKVQTLEFFDETVPKLAISGRAIPPTKAIPGVTVMLHGKAHPIGLWQVLLAKPITADAAKTLKVRVQAHLANLMDPVPDPQDLDAIAKNPLTDEQKKKPDVKSK